jgi:hypothetical protein
VIVLGARENPKKRELKVAEKLCYSLGGVKVNSKSQSENPTCSTTTTSKNCILVCHNLLFHNPAD